MTGTRVSQRQVTCTIISCNHRWAERLLTTLTCHVTLLSLRYNGALSVLSVLVIPRTQLLQQMQEGDSFFGLER